MVDNKKMSNARNSYESKEQYLESHYKKSKPFDFYRDLFPVGSFRKDKTGVDDGECCGIFSFKGEKDTLELMKKKARQKIIFDSDIPTMMKYFNAILKGSNEEQDLERKYDSLDHRFHAGKYRVPGKPIQCDWILHDLVHDDLAELKTGFGKRTARMAPIGYFGDEFKSENAHMLFAIVLDLDGVGIEQLKNLLYGFDNKGYICPTYLVNSGNGLHLYYMLEEPIPLYNYVKKPITYLKEKLIDQLWNKYTSKITNHKDPQPWSEDFRMVGSLSKLGVGYPVTAFKIGKRVTLEDLNNELYKGDRIKLPLTEYRPKGRTGKTLEECKELYPEWYKRVILHEKGYKQTRNSYTMHRAVYDSWLERIKNGKKVGTRYHCISMLFAAAIKCDIDYDEVYVDALDLLNDFDNLARNDSERFTKEDIDSASLYYKDCFRNVSLDAIESKTEIILPRNKRNGRKQEEHLKMVYMLESNGFIKDARFGAKDGNNPTLGGRPTKEQIVRDYLKEHPDAKKAQVIKDTGLSKPTVYRWYNIIKGEELHAKD